MTLRRSVALTVVSALVAAPAFAGESDETARPEAATVKVAELVISGGGAEDPKPRQPFGKQARNFRLELERIREMAADPELAGVNLVVKGVPGYAKTLDLLTEIEALKDAGKTIVCFSEVLSRGPLMLASIADHLVVPPSGMIALEGLSAEVMYYADLLEKLNVQAEVLHIGDYKTAYENFARNSMSDGQRTSVGDILDESWNQVLELIAQNREIPEVAVEGLFARLLVDPQEAAEAGLIDAVAYADEFDAQVAELLGGEVELIEDYGDVTDEDIAALLESPFGMFTMMGELLNPPKVTRPEEPYVGIVYATGAIVSGKSTSDFQGNVSNMGSDTIVAALEDLAEDEHCKAVVLRVNSPGGSALASDMIWRAIERTKQHKPVISSMGSVAASGGYWISMGCNAIVAQPSTLTGSIGVVSMLPDVHHALNDLGVNVEVVSRGPHGDQLSLLANGPSQLLKDTLTNSMLDTYDQFLGKVSVGRGLSRERVHELGQGRVWTGRQAEQNGLVDTLGGLADAISLACAMGGLDEDAAPVVELPAPPNPMEAIEEALGGLARVQFASPLERALAELGVLDELQALQAAALDPRPFTADRVQAVLPFHVTLR